jgi:predicted nucleotidyltransferase
MEDLKCSAGEAVVAAKRQRSQRQPPIPTENIILYGNRARGDIRPDSGFDFLVIKDADEPATDAMRRSIWRCPE